MAQFYLGTKDYPNLIASSFLLHRGEKPEERRIGVVVLKEISEIADDATVIGVYEEVDSAGISQIYDDPMTGKSFKAYAVSVFPTFKRFR